MIVLGRCGDTGAAHATHLDDVIVRTGRKRVRRHPDEVRDPAFVEIERMNFRRVGGNIPHINQLEGKYTSAQGILQIFTNWLTPFQSPVMSRWGLPSLFQRTVATIPT